MSQLINILLTTLAPILIIAGLGALLDRTKVIETRAISRVIIYLASPALAFYGIATSSITTAELGDIVLFSFLSIGAITVVAWLVSVGAGMDRVTASGFVLAAALMNAINYGVPLNKFAFGQAGLERALVMGVLFGIYANVVGVFLASWGRASVGQAVRNAFSVPAPYAAVLGLVVNLTGWSMPSLLIRFSSLLADAAIPLMLILLGVQVSRASFAGQWRVMIGASAVRLLGGTAIGFLFVFLLGLEGVTRQVAIVESAMPTAVIATILATEFNSDARLVSSCTFLSTFLSVVTLPLLILLIS